MSIKIHLVFSFLIHSLILTYFLSLPVYKTGIDVLPFEEYFVYLRSEEGRESGEQSSKGKGETSGLQEQVNEKKDNETTLLAQQVDKEKITQQEVSSSKGHVIEIIKEGVIEHKVFKVRDASEEGKETVEYLEEKQPDTAKEVPEDLKKGVIVYEGTVLKTMPGFTVIPYEEVSGVEILHAKRQGKKETHEVEVLEKQKGLFLEEVEEEEIRERIDVAEVRKDETYEKVRKEIESIKREIYKERGLLSKESKVKISPLDEKKGEDFWVQREATPSREVLKEEIAEAEEKEQEQLKTETALSKVIHLHEKTEPAIPAEVDAGLLLETKTGTMTMPEEELPGETLRSEEEILRGEKAIDEVEWDEAEKESLQEFVKIEEPFDRLRVEEKLKYLKSSVKEKKNKIREKELLTDEHERETITEKISILAEKQGKPEKPVAEIVKSLREKASSETDQMEKEKGTDLREEIADNQLSEGISAKQIVSPDIYETGLLLTSIPGNPTVPFEKEFKTALTKEKAVDRVEFEESGVKETALKTLDSKQTFDTVESKGDSFNDKERVPTAMKRVHQESEIEDEKIQSESSIERVIDAPFTVKTDIFREFYQDDYKKEETEIEDGERVVAEGLIQENNRISLQEDYSLTLHEKERKMTADFSPELKEEAGADEKEPFLGISMPDVFFKKDIKIEISLSDPEATQVLFQLMKKGHPLDEKDKSQNQKEIELVEDTDIDYTLGYKRVFSTAKAEKGVYIFMIKNNGSKGYEADVLFYIFEGKSGERRKEYKTIELPPNTTLKYKFIIPEAIFWDDEDYFTGTIESSNTLTKFNEKTGLIWKEKKDF